MYTQIIYHLKPLTLKKKQECHADLSEYLEMETTYNQPNNYLQ